MIGSNYFLQDSISFGKEVRKDEETYPFNRGSNPAGDHLIG
jgi:hypothetical protein